MQHSINIDQLNHIITFSGDIDLESSPTARHILLDVVNQAHTVVVDLSAVTYMDSSGIASLVEAYQHAKQKGVIFVLVTASSAVLRVLKMARLDKVFIIHETLDHAKHAITT